MAIINKIWNLRPIALKKSNKSSNKKIKTNHNQTNQIISSPEWFHFIMFSGIMIDYVHNITSTGSRIFVANHNITSAGSSIII